MYENGNFKISSKEPSRLTEVKYLRTSEKFMIGKRENIAVSHNFQMANLFVLKRFTLPAEYKSMVYRGIYIIFHLSLSPFLTSQFLFATIVCKELV